MGPSLITDDSCEWREVLNETQPWLRRAYKRNLLKQKETASLKVIIDELAPKLNAYLKSIGTVPVAQQNH